MQKQIIDKKLESYVHRCLPRLRAKRHGRTHQHDHAGLFLRAVRRAAAREAIEAIKKSIYKTYGKKGEEIVHDEFQGGGLHAVENLHEVNVPAAVNSAGPMLRPSVAANAPAFVQ